MRKPILCGLVVLMLLGLMVYIGDVSYGANNRYSEEFFSVPGICKAPVSLLQSIGGGLSSGSAWLRGPGDMIKSQLQGVTALIPDLHMASALLDKYVPYLRL
jgi:hypothetical protein